MATQASIERHQRDIGKNRGGRKCDEWLKGTHLAEHAYTHELEGPALVGDDLGRGRRGDLCILPGQRRGRGLLRLLLLLGRGCAGGWGRCVAGLLVDSVVVGSCGEGVSARRGGHGGVERGRHREA